MRCFFLFPHCLLIFGQYFGGCLISILPCGDCCTAAFFSLGANAFHIFHLFQRHLINYFLLTLIQRQFLSHSLCFIFGALFRSTFSFGSFDFGFFCCCSGHLRMCSSHHSDGCN